MTNESRIVEIAGVKVEVDLREARVVDSFRVGDNVAVLVKKWGDTFEVHPGVIAAFDDFPTLPTITVAYLEAGKLHRVHLNAKSTNVEIVPLTVLTAYFEKEDVLSTFDKSIATAETALAELRLQRAYFVAYLRSIWRGDEHESIKGLPEGC